MGGLCRHSFNVRKRARESSEVEHGLRVCAHHHTRAQHCIPQVLVTTYTSNMPHEWMPGIANRVRPCTPHCLYGADASYRQDPEIDPSSVCMLWWKDRGRVNVSVSLL